MPASVDEFKNDSDPPISSERLNEPFHIKSAVYDSGNDEIQITIGQGRSLFGNNTVIEKTSDTNITVSGPSTNTEYFVYLNSNGQFLTSTSLDTDKVLLGSVETGGSLNDQDAQNRHDYREMGLGGKTTQLRNELSPHGQSFHATDSVGQNEIAAGSVGRSEVKTSTASSSGSGTGPAFSVNAYSFAVAIQGRYSSVDQNRNITVQRGADDANNYNGAHADTPYFYPDGPDAWEGSWRYLQSSPPYDLGDGRVGAFVYLDVEKNDGIRSVWIAEDPPWYGIGTRFVNGQPHYIEPSGPSFDQVRSGEITPREWSESTPGLNRTPVSDDPHRYKHRRPSPFPRTDNVALLDPSCDLCHELFLRHVELAGMPDEPNLTEILRDGYFEIKKDVTDQRNASIPGVSIVEGAWK